MGGQCAAYVIIYSPAAAPRCSSSSKRSTSKVLSALPRMKSIQKGHRRHCVAPISSSNVLVPLCTSRQLIWLKHYLLTVQCTHLHNYGASIRIEVRVDQASGLFFAQKRMQAFLHGEIPRLTASRVSFQRCQITWKFSVAQFGRPRARSDRNHNVQILALPQFRKHLAACTLGDLKTNESDCAPLYTVGYRERAERKEGGFALSRDIV